MFRYTGAMKNHGQGRRRILIASLEIIALTCFIDMREERDIATIYILNAFVQIELKSNNSNGGHKKFIMKIKGKITELVVQTVSEILTIYHSQK